MLDFGTVRDGLIRAACAVLVQRLVTIASSILRSWHDWQSRSRSELSILERRETQGCPCNRKQPDLHAGRFRASDGPAPFPLAA